MDLSRIVAHWAAFPPDRVAVHCAGADLTWAAPWRRVEAATLRLAALGVHKGDRVAYLRSC